MKYLLFADRLSYGGGEKVRNWLATQLAKAGDTVFYATSNLTEDYQMQLKTLGLDDYIHIVQYDFSLKKRKPLSYFSSICKLYTENKIDAIVYFGGSLIEQLAARKTGVKIFLSERFYNGFRSFPSRILKHIQYRIADGYVFQTPEAAKTYGKRAERIGTVIPNPIIDDLPDPIFDNIRKEIVTAGRLSHQKDHNTLIEAFSIFHKQHSEYSLIIYGSGELKEELEAKIANLNLTPYVSIISGKTNISELERGAELFVLSSIAEGMPNALIEAMSVGVQCISTDCPAYGSRLLVSNGVNGYLVPVGDINRMAEMMCYAIEHPNEADSIRKNALKIRETLNPDMIFNRWHEYFETIMRK